MRIAQTRWRASSLMGTLAMLAAFSAAGGQIDAAAAVKIARSEHCLRCHGVTKKKEGPPYTVIAAFYRSDPDAEQTIYKHVTGGRMVKLTDGHKESHKAIVDKSPEQIMNLVRWILSQ